MISLNALFALLFFQLIGETITRTLGLPIPGPVIGMLLLFITLLFKDKLVTKIEPTSQFILQNLTLLYIPAAVGIITHFTLLRKEGIPLLITLCLSLMVTVAATAVVMNFFIIRKEKKAFQEAK